MEAGNNAACRRYYQNNTDSAKRRVLLSDIRNKGRLPTEQTLALWGITVHEVIDAYRVHMQNCATAQQPPKKLGEFRILVGNML